MIGGAAPATVRGDITSGEIVEASFPSQELPDSGRLESKVWLQWSAGESVLRKWAAFRVVGAASPVLVSEVVFEDVDLAGTTGLLDRQPAIQPPYSYPVFLKGFFAGVEFPVASTRIETARVVIAHQPGVWLRTEAWYETRKAVFGTAPPGGEWDAFARYVEGHRPSPKGRHVNYNHWWSTPVWATERDILGLMDTFHEKLWLAHAVAFDTFCIDVGWPERKSVWEMDRTNFPEGFARIQPSATRMGTALGIWVSPSSVYPAATNVEWLGEHGYETARVTRGEVMMDFACLGGNSYQSKFKEQLLDMVRRYDLHSIKFDAYIPTCPATNHGHEPGPLSADAIAEGMIDIFRSLRQVQPEIWLRPTCFGLNPSPWWLFYTNSVIGAFGDDAPYGRVPSPVHRESYTTARDYFNLQGAWWSPVPLAAEEVLGICHQTDEPFLNDAVMVVMRGHSYLPLYLNPQEKYMDDRRWSMLSSLLSWSREQYASLANPQPLLPSAWQENRAPRFSNDAVMPRQPYGYAHGHNGRGLVVLRNPWIAPASYALPLDETCGVATGAAGLAVVSLYPEARRYEHGRKYGDVLDIRLAPYETLLLSIFPGESSEEIPEASSVLGAGLEVVMGVGHVRKVEFQADMPAYGLDWTCPLGEARAAIHVVFEGTVHVAAPAARIVIIVEGKRSPDVALRCLQIDGTDVSAEIQASDDAWAASTIPAREHWTVAQFPLHKGVNRVLLDLLASDHCAGVSAWVWATRPGDTGPCRPDSLPEPELVTLGAAALVAPADITLLPQAVSMQRFVERIDGVFLDALDPVVSQQGWGTLQRNKSVWEKPLSIAGKRYLRGIGVSSQAKIEYSLDGRYRQFQAWVGADGATSPSVTFEVKVDGRTVWQSGLMLRDTPAKRVDVNVAGASRLELLVGDGGDGITSDHADWADARLLR